MMRPSPASLGPAEPSIRESVVVVGPLPPPATGMTAMTRMLLDALPPEAVIHVDTSDHRPVNTIGRLDFTNVLLALKHCVSFWRAVARPTVRVAYVPIAQNLLGYLRDALLLATARLFRRRIVVHLHGGYFDRFYAGSGPISRWAIRASMDWVDTGIVLGDSLRHCLEPLLGPSRVVVVSNAVRDDGRITVRPPDRFGVLHTSNLQRSKGSLTVLKAFGMLSRRCPEARLVLAGGWNSESDRAEALEIIREFDLADLVEMPGYVDDEEKARLMARSHAFVMPSSYRYEGQPMVVLEAAQAGVPAIVSDHAALRETVIDGVTGRVMDDPNAEGLADELERWCRNPDLVQAMGAAARERYLECYTPALFGERMRAVLLSESPAETQRRAG